MTAGNNMKNLAMQAVVVLGMVSGLPFQEEFFTAYVDNYAYTGETYQMRYFISAEYVPAQGGYPLVFYTGNEGDVELYLNNTGFMLELGQNISALLVFAEHRYYGKSLPFLSPTVEQLKYFSPHQALADYAYLLAELLDTYDITGVVAVGGSYGGMLASWIRIKYPHLVDGALASSAPDLHFTQITDPNVFAQISTLAFSEESSVCVQNIRLGFETLRGYVQNIKYYYQLDQIFHTCEVTSTAATAELLLEWAVDGLTGLAELNYPYGTNYGVELPEEPVEYACDMIGGSVAQTQTEALELLFNASNVYYNYSGSLPCTNLSPTLTDGMPWLWSYIRCTTLIMPIGFTGTSDMFYPKPWDLPSFQSFCQARFGRILSQVRYPMIMYGATNTTKNLFIYLSNVVFSNGEIDPWQSGGVFGDINPQVTTIYIENSAHHFDLRGSNSNDFPAVIAAREEETAIIRDWLGLGGA